MLVIGGGVLSSLAVYVALSSMPNADFRLDPGQRSVEWTRPGGQAWTDGIRVGDTVVLLAQPTALDWDLVARRPHGAVHGTSADASVESLRRTAGQAFAAVAAAVVALVLLRWRWRLAGPTALAAIALAIVPLSAAAEIPIWAAAAAGLPLVMASWVLPDLRRSQAVGLGVMTLLISAGWMSSSLQWPTVYPVAEAARVALMMGLLIIAGWLAAPWPQWIARSVRLDPAFALDVAALTLLVSAAVLAVVIGASPWLVITGVICLLAVYPGIRRRLRNAAEHVLFAEMRDHAATAAAEEERARLAGEIHDGPLQDLAAVISDLDAERQLSGAAATLRGVASQLRDVTIALRPPVLDDLGLAAAIAWLCDVATDRARMTPVISCAVHDQAGVRRDQRPPGDVELAAFRIVQEALTNAVRHAHGTRVAVAGIVRRHSIDLTVEDDGDGLDEAAARTARREGRLGLSSMRQRAASIRADFSVRSRPGGGTVVAIRWDAK
jgi:signal transduction histidine kinase